MRTSSNKSAPVCVLGLTSVVRWKVGSGAWNHSGASMFPFGRSGAPYPPNWHIVARNRRHHVDDHADHPHHPAAVALRWRWLLVSPALITARGLTARHRSPSMYVRSRRTRRCSEEPQGSTATEDQSGPISMPSIHLCVPRRLKRPEEELSRPVDCVWAASSICPPAAN